MIQYEENKNTLIHYATWKSHHGDFQIGWLVIPIECWRESIYLYI